MMILKRFQVTNFRSVADSEWIDTDDVTALIGTNEAGKTNILLPPLEIQPGQGRGDRCDFGLPEEAVQHVPAPEAEARFYPHSL